MQLSEVPVTQFPPKVAPCRAVVPTHSQEGDTDPRRTGDREVLAPRAASDCPPGATSSPGHQSASVSMILPLWDGVDTGPEPVAPGGRFSLFHPRCHAGRQFSVRPMAFCGVQVARPVPAFTR